ncbi:hypothetical protein J4E93_000710 [Alternaria ventricosa]|uniref:uncharacterized protein n=1 Tax=Alternaria ventricosa TaxID=1187951 RepID=UPI0020C4AF99|nr:uncharacterized protein J4E93_000710 [Alternaria ventricosa]KAI4655994.1 hypothetical protein J4E93_000710 [Alternaria ventricosa]
MSATPMPSGFDYADAPIELAWSSQRPELRDETEDWMGVTNPVERRKLQNRLNQRARRNRAQKKNAPARQPRRVIIPEEANKSDTSGREGSCSTSDLSLDDLSNPDVAIAQRSCMAAHPKVQELMRRFSEHAYASYMQGTPALSHLPLLLKYNVASGLARNADILGVTAQYYDWYGISPLNKQGPLLGSDAGAEWPACLQPTELQASIEHHPWLDLFPWPKVRDNMLQAFQRTEPIDYEDALCHDICEYNHLDRNPILIVWGPPEDYRSWEIDPIFLEKWGWLLSGCPEVYETTNYWRATRGEKLFTPQQWHNTIQSSLPKELHYSVHD